MSSPPSVIVGSLDRDPGTAYNANNNEVMVDLPDPDRPTMAVQVFCETSIETSFKTTVSGLEGYRKKTLVSLIGVRLEMTRDPRCSCDPNLGRFESSRRRVAISLDVLI
jgi:hypothetical protein